MAFAILLPFLLRRRRSPDEKREFALGQRSSGKGVGNLIQVVGRSLETPNHEEDALTAQVSPRKHDREFNDVAFDHRDQADGELSCQVNFDYVPLPRDGLRYGRRCLIWSEIDESSGSISTKTAVVICGRPHRIGSDELVEPLKGVLWVAGTMEPIGRKPNDAVSAVEPSCSSVVITPA